MLLKNSSKIRCAFLATGMTFCLAPYTTGQATASEFSGSQPVQIEEHLPAADNLPDVHFWTGPDGTPQLDYRAAGNFLGCDKVDPRMPAVNQYGGAINNGCWRGFRCVAVGWKLSITNNGTWLDLGPDVSPQILDLEKCAMSRDDAVARTAAHKNALSKLQLKQSGIFWGPEKERNKHRSGLGEGSPSHEATNGRSYLKGPVRIFANYIRFDGPVSRIGDDVSLVARRIVVNGVDLPPASWREALAKLEEYSTADDAK